jgi:hypothetical protein
MTMLFSGDFCGIVNANIGERTTRRRTQITFWLLSTQRRNRLQPVVFLFGFLAMEAPGSACGQWSKLPFYRPGAPRW